MRRAEAVRALRTRLLADHLRELLDSADTAITDDLLRLGDWVTVPGGSRLFSQGDPGDSMYVLVAGRLVASREDTSGSRRIVGRIRAGESVGEMGLLARQPRTATVQASRDSVVIRISERAFQQVVSRHPEMVSGIARLMIRRTTDVLRGRSPIEERRNIAVVPLRSGAGCGEFVERLARALGHLGPTRVVDRASCEDVLLPRGAPDANDESNDVALSTWLDEQELLHDSLVYAAERIDGAWAQRCVRQADVVLLVAPFDHSTELRPEELHLRPGGSGGPRRELVLLHPRGAPAPVGTSRWVGPRDVARHHHVRMDREDDFRRLARFLTGNAVGLVLGGGGARGFAHVGVVRALREAGIPIDAAGGTSQGAIVAAMVAMDWDDRTIERAHEDAFTRRNPIGDYALVPHVALVKGKRLMAALERGFGRCDVEDTWRPFFCVSANLTLARAEVHVRGPLCRALRASVSIPGLLPPVVIGEHLHVDGALLDNLPVEAMRAAGVGHVIAVDLAVSNEVSMTRGELPSALEFLKARLLPGLGRAASPGLGAILVKSLMMSSMQRAREVGAAADLVLKPDPKGIGLVEWTALDRAIALGYRCAKEELARGRVTQWVDRDAGTEVQ